MASSEPKFDFLDPPSQPGDLGTLSHYRVINELGRGGMGYVFRAEDKKLQREVALKVMNQKVAGTPHSRRRFIREARAMAAVHHDNVATIFEVGENAGTTFMAMEMLQGGTLETFNEDGRRLNFEEIIRYASQIARGLAAAHKKGIVHRDIKPANIWIESGKDRIKILDFGLALASTPVDQLSGRGAVIGTPGYLSPEQARTEPLDDRSDLYSLGVVLYELCTGRLPLHANTVAGQLIAILAHRPALIVELNPEIPVPLADLIHRLLFKEPRARVRSAEELEKELVRVEAECHAKSEVAQTINKLQQGLEQVVKKKTTEPIAEPEVLDPFATIPAAAATAPAAPVAAPAAAPTFSSPAYPKRPAAKPVSQPANWQKYLPLAAIVALVLIALPIMTYAFTGAGRNNEPILITQLPDSDASSRQNSQSTSNGQSNNRTTNTGATNTSQPQNRQTQQPDAQTQQPGPKSGGNKNTNNSAGKKNNRNGRNRNVQNKASGQGKNNQAANRNNNQDNSSSAPKTPDRTADTTNTAQQRTGQNANAGPPLTAVSAPGKPTPADTSDVRQPVQQQPRDIAPPAPEAITPPVEMEWTNISTTFGRGADVMVQIGTNQKRGLKPSIGVHTRGKIESHHSYLRFDLAEIEEVREEVASAELMLTLVSKTRPVGATLRLYGIASKGLPLWPEDGPRSLTWSNTPSKVGLDSLPLLGSTTIEPSDERTVRITNPELAAFIREAADDTVTLVLAGKGTGGSPILFVSRQGQAEKAPRLLIEAPRESSKQKSGQNNRRRSSPR